MKGGRKGGKEEEGMERKRETDGETERDPYLINQKFSI